MARAPGLSPFGLVMVGPLLMQFGPDAQKKRFLPKIWVDNGHAADQLLVTAKTPDGLAVFVVEAGDSGWTARRSRPWTAAAQP